MDSVRMAIQEGIPQPTQCSRCPATNLRWDRLAGAALCPNCQEELVQGEGVPLVLRTARRPCAVCAHLGSLCYLTFPLGAAAAVEVELCAEHLRALLGRCLEPSAYHQLRRRLQNLGLPVEDIFLLHGAFYDDQGHAFHPALKLE